MTNASKYGILMHSVDNFIQVTVVRDTKEAAMSLLPVSYTHLTLPTNSRV